MVISQELQDLLVQKETLERQIRKEKLIKARQMTALAIKFGSDQKTEYQKKLSLLEMVMATKPFDLGLIDYFLDEIFELFGLKDLVSGE